MTVLTVRLATLALWPMQGPDMLWTRDLGVGRADWGFAGASLLPPAPSSMRGNFMGARACFEPRRQSQRKDLEGP